MREPTMNDMMTYLAIENAVMRWTMEGDEAMVQACRPLMKALEQRIAENRLRELTKETEDAGTK